jgi:MSHA biogenesis protein MshQ
VASSPDVTLANLYFDTTGTATLSSFSYPDAGQVTLYPTYAGSSATNDASLSLAAVSGNVFIAAPASFAFSVPAAPLTAGTPFNVTLTAKNACSPDATTPNFGKETTPATVTLTSTHPQPALGNATAINQTVSGFSSGAASTNVTWKEVGTVDLVATATNYLSSGLSPTSTKTAVGRFKPAYFETAFDASVTNPKGCTNFTYSDQPMAFAITARAAGGTTTANYAGGTWAKDVTLSDANNGTGTWSNNTIFKESFSAGVGKAGATKYKFATKATPPYTLTVRASEPLLPDGTPAPDSDGVSSATGSDGTSAAAVEATTSIASGRVNLLNAYGSELLALPLTTQIEYYNTAPSAGWRVAKASVSQDAAYVDQCTNLAATNFAFTTSPACTTAVPSCMTALSVNDSAGASASSPWTTKLTKPTAAGSVCITLNLDGTAVGARCTATGIAVSAAAPWLQYPWTSSTASNPTARATFGVYKSPLIFRRENY